MKHVLVLVLLIVSTVKGFATALEIFPDARSYHQSIQDKGIVSGTTLKIFGAAIERPGDVEFKVTSSKLLDEGASIVRILMLQLDNGGSITLLDPYILDLKALSRGNIIVEDAREVIFTDANGRTKYLERHFSGTKALELVD